MESPPEADGEPALRRPGGVERQLRINVLSSPVASAPRASIAPLDSEVRQAGANESWLRTISAELEREEYAAKPTKAGLQAPNSAHNLHTTFGEHGIEVVPRTDKRVAPAWRFAWETSGFGRSGQIQEVAPASPDSRGGRVTYRREGWSEWYENTASGLEQGFTIEDRPTGEGALRIEGKVAFGLRPEAREDGAIDFIESHGACAIRYGALRRAERSSRVASTSSAWSLMGML